MTASSPRSTVEPEQTPEATPPSEETQTPGIQNTPPVKDNSIVTRAALAMMLAEQDGADLSGYTVSRFTDIPADHRYMSAVTWAADIGIATGVGGGLFNPDTTVSREQMAIMLYKYMRYKDCYAVSGTASVVSDSQQINAWALDAVNAIRCLGIISDKTADTFDPQGSVTKTEAAEAINRLVNYITMMTEAGYPGNQDLDDYGDWLPPYETPSSTGQTDYREETLTIPKE